MIAAFKTPKPLNPRSADTKYVGDEPVWRQQPIEGRLTALTRAFNWYNYFYGKKDAKDFVAMYMETHGRAKDAKKIRALADNQLSLTIGWLCRMSLMGLQLNDSEQIKLDNMLAELLTSSDPSKQAEVDKGVLPRLNIQDRLREKVSECLGEIDGLFDEFIASGAKLNADFKPVALMRGMNVAPQMIPEIRSVWAKKLIEFEDTVTGKDAQLTEAYSFLGKTQLKSCVKFCELVLSDCGAYVQIKKVERKPRAAKAVTPEKQAAKFKILLEIPELKIKGLPAASLVEKTEAWLYDSKKRKLIHVVADSHVGTFTVKSNSIIGFSTAESQQRTVRKPADIIKLLLTAGKPAARKIYKDLTTTETQFNGRGTENLVILKAW